MEKAPRVSFIVPIHNGEKLMHLALDSILAQTEQDFEVLAVNHRSSDGTAAVLEEYAKKWPDKIRTFAINTGTTASTPKNLALKNAKGSYIAFIDCDDRISPDYLQKMLAVSENDSVEMIGCGVASVTEQGEIVSTSILRENRETGDFAYYRHGAATAALVRRDFLLKNALFFPENKLPEDVIYSNAVAYLANKRVLIDDIGYYYIAHPGSVTHNGGFSSFSQEQMPLDEYESDLPVIFKTASVNPVETYQYALILSMWALSFVFCRHSSTRNIAQITRRCSKMVRLYALPMVSSPMVYHIGRFKNELGLYVRLGVCAYACSLRLHLEVPFACATGFLFKLLRR